MSLAERITQIEQTPRCSTCRWWMTLSDKDKAAFTAYLESTPPRPGKYSELRKACLEYGLEAGDKAFRDHINNVNGRHVVS